MPSSIKNDTPVCNADARNTVLSRLAAGFDTRTREAQKAARHAMEHPAQVGVSRVGEIARAAKVRRGTLLRMARRPGFAGFDDLAWADGRDVLVGMTCRPCRTEVVRAVRPAREQGASVVALSGGPASAIVLPARHARVVACPCHACPCHAWTCELAGELRSAPGIRVVPGVDRTAIRPSLPPFPQAVVPREVYPRGNRDYH